MSTGPRRITVVLAGAAVLLAGVVILSTIRADRGDGRRRGAGVT
ncbi:MAG: hypothetical protein WA964_15130 [Ilumatobacter sp.]